nr:MAG TPA: hypothetical protein [Caudoviricetes sp.]
MPACGLAYLGNAKFIRLFFMRKHFLFSCISFRYSM